MYDFKNNLCYQELRKAISERAGDFVAVLGAGISAQAGLPTWKQLAEYLIEQAKKYNEENLMCEEKSFCTLNFEQIEKEIEKGQDLWKVIDRIRKYLPKGLFEQAVKTCLKYESPPKAPNIMINLWKIGVKGIVTPNLDSLACDAYACCYEKQVDCSDSLTSKRYLDFLGDERHFVFQPHGSLKDPNSWILSNDTLAKILKEESYRTWWDRLLSSRNLIFIGINESDVSIRSYLLGNSSKRKHYVISPITARGRLSLLEESDFYHIPYEVYSDASNGFENHSQLSEIIENLLSATPIEIMPPAAYQGPIKTITDLPAPEDLRKLPFDEIRYLLNGVVASLLPNESDAEDEILKSYSDLRRTYLPIFNSVSSVDPQSDYNFLHGYKVLDVVGEGAFGIVYKAKRLKDEKIFSIKILHQQIISSGKHLNAFRRGAYAMRILTKSRVGGIAAFEEAFEVPFSIVMEYIEGQDLESAVQSQLLKSLTRKLQVIYRIAEIVHSAHSIHEQILHRDLKPGNILLKGFSYEDENPKKYVKIVDFDLSWHKYATTQTIIHNKGSHGYAAPELIDRSLGSSRKASVDVYGLGMLLYFILTGHDPMPGMVLSPDFEIDLANDIRRIYKSKWSALGKHLSNIVKICTENDPKKRCTIPDFLAMIETAISLELDDTPGDYLPIIGIQIFEDVVSESDILCFEDHRRTITCSRLNKKIKVEMKSLGSSVRILTKVSITKDNSHGGSDPEKRDKKIEERIKRSTEIAGFHFSGGSNKSRREFNINCEIRDINIGNIKKYSSVLRYAWEEIDKN
jgi:eukaryotic-like serine/threonine-protein kinase